MSLCSGRPRPGKHEGNCCGPGCPQPGPCVYEIMHCVKPGLIVVLFFFSAVACAQLSIAPASLPDATLGANYYQELQSGGGTGPYHWSIRGDLPAGISFDAATGTLTGIADIPGNFRFTVVLTDSARHSATRTYQLRVGAGTTITIAWTRAPVVADGGIAGEVEIANPGREAFDLTFIAVAVNEIGRATALGYQHFSLSPGKQKIAFSGNLPRGTYVVHADAVGEIARSGIIRRARLQVQPLVIP